MSQDFSHQNLQGRSFRGQNLEGANFYEANIRGANFTNADLREANFVGTKAGLQRRWVIFLIIISWLLSIISGRLVGFAVIFTSSLFNVSSDTFNISDYLDSPLIFIIIFAIISTAIVTVALIGAVVNAIAVASAVALAGSVAGTIAVVISIVIVRNVILANVIAKAGALAVAVGITCVLVSAYIGWSAITKQKQQFFVWRITIVFAATGGTSFRGTDLTDADFTQATLKSTDFRRATLTRTCWHNAKKLDRVRPGTTYLSNQKLRQLAITGEGQNENFDRLDLRGVNLQGANLENASFIDADFYQANLQGANLSRTILLRTNFERADLRDANLTGSCIQDWVITESTKLDGIACDYVYLNWVNGDKRDQMPPRGKFKEGGFVTFVRYILETVELYHEKDINPRLALTVLQKMAKDYDEPLDIVALGKKGERVFIQVKVSKNIQRENFKEDSEGATK